MPITPKGQKAKDILAKYPDTPFSSLARKLYNANKLLYKDAEDARKFIRIHAGMYGERRRKSVKDVISSPQNPFNLPKSYAQERKIHKLPTANNNILVISDLHVPYHDIDAITLAIQYGKKQKVNTIVINGDLIDFCLLSRFEKDPTARSIKEEFDATRSLLEVLRKNFPTAEIIWLKGNHDTRYEKWLFSKAVEIFDDPYYLLEERLRLSDLRIKLLDDNILIKAGRLNITHGHLVIRGIFAPVNAARGVYLRTKTSTLIGHVHNSSEHTEKDLNSGMVTCWSVGCLCTLHPNYDPYNTKHNVGFAHVLVEKNGDFSVINKRVHNGKIL